MDLRNTLFVLLLPVWVNGCLQAADKRPKPAQLSPLDRYILESSANGTAAGQNASGSLWSPAARLADLAGDVRARQIHDLVTILVVESASAIAQGSTKTSRQSAVKSGVTAVGGVKNPAGPLANLAQASTASQLDGQGATSRSTQLNTTLSARVTHVLPNGYLVLEGSKDVVVNAERQVVTVRGVVRPADLSAGNTINSDQIAQLELKVNGKGVVGDAVRRPFILYRLLLGLLPF
jgi:flagellar L-ring protein FlgH